MILNVGELNSKIKGINRWIEENPQVTEPNMYEMLDCLTNLGVIARNEEIGYTEHRYPNEGTELYDVYKGMSKMINLRLGWDNNKERLTDENFSVNENTELYEYFMKLHEMCFLGELPVPQESEKVEDYLETLKKLGSVNLYINQQRIDNPNFVYGNVGEYEQIKAKVEEFKDKIPFAKDIFMPIEKEHEIFMIKSKEKELEEKEQELNELEVDSKSNDIIGE